MAHITFPDISEKQRRQMLALPDGPVRVVIDTDAQNEIDDQFALAWALLSQDNLKIEGVYAAPYSFGLHRDGLLQAYDIINSSDPDDTTLGPLARYKGWAAGLKAAGIDPRGLVFNGPDIGMERSYEEILLIYDKLGQDSTGLVYRGADRYLESMADPVRSPAVDHLIERALSPEAGPLYVAAIGCITNIVSAILLAPEIIHKIVVVWTSGYPSTSYCVNTSFNLEQDMLASKLIYDCGVPLVYLPGFHIGAQLRLSLPEMEQWVRGQGTIGDYLYWLYTHNPIQAQRGIADHFGRTWIIWDLINIAWLLEPDWVPTELVPTPVLGDDKKWHQAEPNRRSMMREAYEINRDAIFRDFFTKLQRAAREG